MIADLKPYPEYKEWDLPWLDSVPKHWDMAPNRALMKEQRDKVGEKARDYTLLSLTLRGVIARDMVNPKGKFPAQFNAYKVVRPNDFVFCLFDIDETPRGVGLSPHNGMITGAYDVFSPTHRINPRFLYYYYLFIDDGKLMKPYYTGLRKTIQRGVFASLKAPLPPPAEQAAIVRFLDHWNGRLEKAIRSKRRVIALLQEQKQAIIHRAVTRGLDPNVKLKDSGIPWLGEIPEHWEARKLGSLFLRHGSGTTPSGDAYYGGGVPWVMSGDLKDGILATTKRTVTESALNDFSALKLHPKGSLLVAMYGATIGKTGVLNMAACSNQACCALASPRPQVNPVFIQSIVIMARPHLMQQAYGGGQPNINAEVVRSLRVPLPPLVEQDSILAYVDRATAPIGTAIARFEREITLLREYRTRLTADVVTGKLDVRAAAAQLPEEAEEEPLPDPELPEEETEMEEVEG